MVELAVSPLSDSISWGRYPRVGCRGSSIINGIRVQSARPSERGPGSGGGVERETERQIVFFRSESETRPTDE